MILSVGEILVDMLQDGDSYHRYLGGAPFNMSVYAKRAGAKVCFVGRVGKDGFGEFLKEKAKNFGLDELYIQTDDNRNTTLAFVFLENGERDFAFYRENTADYNISLKEIDFSAFKNLNVVHLGSLMLSTSQGLKTAEQVVKIAKDLNLKLSFDVNFRADIFENESQAISTYLPFIENADVVKFSEDEIKLFANTQNLNDALKRFDKKDRLLVVTTGAKGSLCRYNGNEYFQESKKVKPVDTTGAGDAFYGTFLANIEGKPFNEENVRLALKKANTVGAETTQHHGAIKM